MHKLTLAAAQLKDKWKTKKDRRQILAFVGAGVFLLISFWTSFEDRRLKEKIANAKVVEKIESGRISIPDSPGADTSIVTLQLDETGRVTAIESEPSLKEEVSGILANSNFTAMRRNNLPQQTKVPVPVPLMTPQTKEEQIQSPGEKQEKAERKR